uniref:Uncharacterized protein n=1 Tax=Zea mays TaxID=4577 RepID=C4J762_MAIZE|nr:unknown [Zea mays]
MLTHGASRRTHSLKTNWRFSVIHLPPRRTSLRLKFQRP